MIKRYCHYTGVIIPVLLFTACEFSDQKVGTPDGWVDHQSESNMEYSSGLYCTAQPEETDYNVYKMNADGYRIGDVMPYYEASTGEFYIYYLNDIWDDPTNQRHPWHGFRTTNFYQYQAARSNASLDCSTDGCDQDFALGTGSVIKHNGQYYAFYTGHNPNYPSSCVTKKEGIMLAKAKKPNQKFTKQTGFTTIYAPTGQGYDEQDSFRDPFVFRDVQNNRFVMLISARKDVNGTWKGVIARYISTDLLNWTYDGVSYDGGNDNFFMMECAEVFEMNGTYYLLFSDINSKYVYYRKGNTANGPWSLPTGLDRIEGTGIYAAKTVADNNDRYILGWTPVNSGHSDDNAAAWGGNLVVHKLYQLSNGDLAVTIPHTLEAHMESNSYALVVNSQWGDVTNTGTNSYQVVSTTDYNMSNVIFDPVAEERYEISTTVSYSTSTRDFGFMLGACDGWNDLFSLRFVPSQGRFSFDKTPRPDIDSTTIPDNDVPFAFSPNTDYNIRILVENSMVVVYINDQVALSSRIYRATGTHWGIFSDNSNATFTNIQVTTP